ncbi:p21-activated protein kinase-interacting protein 1-like [Sabethes cyaneus]|uniref:p21-activated protein kinase-interacting protein 1-like n=1 Tax=Sabethes cyaneus TaxID=53552 RepID=UPI00221E32F4|nr:p21-activated protein kinase-interacting protein 1-like [Sabethes cyaneus]
MSGLELIVGTYEEYTVGYKVEPFKTDPSRQYLKEIFSTHSHTASVRAVASHGKILASGGADDRICLFDLENGTLRDELLHHNGTINCLTFSPDGRFLFSGSHDGVISAINIRKLTVEKTWKNAHKSAVLCISIHPQGTIALSLGADMQLRTWDFVTGRTIYTRGLRNDPKFGGYLSWVEWSPDGLHFALVGNRVVDVISTESTKSARTVSCTSKPISFCWISDTEIAVGLDDGHLLMCGIAAGDQSEEPEKIKVYESRLKAIAVVGDHMATASSAGDISLWKIDGRDFREVCTSNIGCRPTCLVLVEADRLGLHRYLKQLEEEDNKEEVKKQIKGIRAVGRVTVEREDSLQQEEEDAGEPTQKEKKKRNKKRPSDGAIDAGSPMERKKQKPNRAMVDSPLATIDDVFGRGSAKKKTKKSANRSSIGVWEEEDLPATE